MDALDVALIRTLALVQQSGRSGTRIIRGSRVLVDFEGARREMMKVRYFQSLLAAPATSEEGRRQVGPSALFDLPSLSQMLLRERSRRLRHDAAWRTGSTKQFEYLTNLTGNSVVLGVSRRLPRLERSCA